MRQRPIAAALMLILAAVSVMSCDSGGDDDPSLPPETSVLGIRSSAFEDNSAIPVKYTCDGENVSPPLTIEPVPPDTESLALIVTDIDGPEGDFVHWTVFNMAPGGEIAEAEAAPLGGIPAATGSGSPGYFGPCPPSGEHHYLFDVYALNTTLTLDATADKAALLAAMDAHILQQSTLTGLYSRPLATATATAIATAGP